MFRHNMRGTRRHGVIVALAAVVMSLTSIGIASSALAREPTGDFAIFKQCPRFTTGVNLCLYSQITSGEMILDKLTIPAVNPVTLQAGIILDPETEGETIVGALNGETLSPIPQPIPGGLSSLIDCHELKHKGGFLGRIRRRACKAMFENSWFTAVNATTELAGPASDIHIDKSKELTEEGVALTLPVKIHLENPLLGKECYIGSNTDPIVFNFTAGKTNPPPPNQPIHGSVGLIAFKDEFEFIEVTEHIQVDNTFSAPQTTGCGKHSPYPIDQLIDNKIGLPSPSGHNTIIHSGYADEGTTIGVIASETGTEEEEETNHQHPDHPKDPNH